MPLHAERRGRGPVLALVHGFTQTGRSWEPLAAELTADHELVLLDAPGHGGSAEVAAGLVEGAGLLAQAAGPATWIGYSMGARYCLHVALQHPEVVQGLVLIGGTAGIDDPDERAARRAQDEATAARLVDQGLDAFLDAWVAQPLFAGLTPDQVGLDDRRRNTVDGLRASLLQAGTGNQEPLWDRVGQVGVPVLVVAGADDAKFSALGARLAEAIGPNAQLALVPDAGHTAHLERPKSFVGILRPWLAGHGL